MSYALRHLIIDATLVQYGGEEITESIDEFGRGMESEEARSIIINSELLPGCALFNIFILIIL